MTISCETSACKTSQDWQPADISGSYWGRPGDCSEYACSDGVVHADFSRLVIPSDKWVRSRSWRRWEAGERLLNYTLIHRQSYRSESGTKLPIMITAWFLGKYWYFLLQTHEVCIQSVRNDGVCGNIETNLSSVGSWKFTILLENAALRSNGDCIQNRW